jgi:hypothetical protein
MKQFALESFIDRGIPVLLFLATLGLTLFFSKDTVSSGWALKALLALIRDFDSDLKIAVIHDVRIALRILCCFSISLMVSITVKNFIIESQNT